MGLSGIQGVKEMRSLTKFGRSQVTLIFRDGMDIYRARQLVAERLQSAADRLPPGLRLHRPTAGQGMFGWVSGWDQRFRQLPRLPPMNRL